MTLHRNRPRLLTIGACACLIGLPSARMGRAQVRSSALELQYEAPDECPPRSAVEQAALRLAERMPRMPVVAHVFIAKEPNGYLAHVRTHAGQRTLQDVSCSSIAEAIEVLLALALDPDARVGRSDGSSAAPTPPMGSTPAPNVPPAPPMASGPAHIPPVVHPGAPVSGNGRHAGAAYAGPTSVQTERVQSDSDSAFLGVLLGVERGALPQLAEVFTIGGGIAVTNRLRIGETARYWRESSQAVPGTSAGGVFSLWALASTACVTATQTPPLVRLCAGVEIGRLSAASFGVRNDGSGGSLWLAPLAALEASLPASDWLSLVLAAEVGLPLVRRGFYLQQVRTAESIQLHAPGVVSTRLHFGLRFGF